MVQPETATGGEAVAPDSSPVKNPIDAIVDDFLGEEEEQQEVPEGTEPEGEGETLEPTEDDLGDETDEGPSIDPPTSWSAEEKEAFKGFPREAQAAIARREAERDQFVRNKSEEVTSAKRTAEKQALEAVSQLQAQYAQQLQAYAQQLVVGEPDPMLQVEDPEAWAHQMRAHKHFTAQREQAQRQAWEAQQQAQQAEHYLKVQEAEQGNALLQDKFPEWLDSVQGPKLRQDLTSIALSLGYSEDQVTQADAKDILAMREVANLKVKADKYDALIAKRMETVRAHKGKNLPPVARPGAAQSRSQASASRAEAAWDRTKQTKSGADFADYLENVGIKL